MPGASSFFSRDTPEVFRTPLMEKNVVSATSGASLLLVLGAAFFPILLAEVIDLLYDLNKNQYLINI
jgi:hypothetical protein